MSCCVTIKTKKAKNVLSTSFETGGEYIIASDPIVEKGVVWGDSPEPTISGTNKKIAGDGKSSFDATLTGLIPSSVYFVRAYATTLCGTVYGAEIQVTTGNVATTDGCVYSSYSIPPNGSFVLPAGYEIVSATNKTYLVNTCGVQIPEDKFKCFGMYPFQANNQDAEGWSAYTENVTYEGLIINDVKYPFSSPVYHEADDEAGYTTAMNNVIDEIKQLPIYLQGLISSVTLCETNEGSDGGQKRGLGAIIGIKGLSSNLTNARMYATFAPDGDDKDYSTELQYPIYTKQQMYDNFAITTCNCPEEELITT